MSNKQSVAEAFGIDPRAADAVPDRVRKLAFFEQLAKHGITPNSEAQAQQLLDASDRLEHKRAAFIAQNDPVQRALGLLAPKAAAAPTAQAAQAPQIIHSIERGSAMDREVSQKTASILQDPEVYAALVTAFTG